MLYIFDWDGTLIDSTAKIVRCMEEAIAEHGLAHLHQMPVTEIIGLGLPEAIRQLLPGISDADVDRVRSAYSLYFTEADQVPCEFFPGVMDTLSVLRQQGHQLAVATGKSRKGLDRVLGNLQLTTFFDATRCADETRSKPDPQMLHELLAELAVGGEEAVMIGDTEFDMAMAQNAGVHRVAVSYGAHHPERLMAYEPALCMDDFRELLDLQV